MAFPSSPTTGKGGKLYLSYSDGTYISTALTLQASATVRGVSRTNLVYLLGAGKTLLNMRPAVEPVINIDGIIDGLIVTPATGDDAIAVSAGTVMVSGVATSISANASVDLSSSRPEATQGAWVAISVNKSTKAITVTKGKDTTAGTGIDALLSTWGDASTGAAGARPFIPVADLLIALLPLTNGAAAIASTEILYYDRESADVDREVLPNLGGAMLSTPLVKLHTGELGRAVNFVGYYLDDVMGEVGTAKSWSLTPSTNQVSDSTFNRNISQTEVSGWTFSAEQLAADSKAKDIILSRQGFCAVRLVYPNSSYFQSAATMAPTFNCATGALNNISISGSLLDDPVFAG